MVSVIRSMKKWHVKPHTDTLVELLDICIARNNSYKPAVSIFQYARDVGIRPNSSMYKRLITIMDNRGYYTSLKKAFKTMVEEDKIAPDKSLSKLLISIAKYEEDYTFMISVIEAMNESGPKKQKSTKKVPNP